MALTERLALLITADATQAVRALDGVGNSSQRLGQTESRLSRVGQTMTRMTPAFIGVGAASMAMFNQFDEGADALRAAGAVGDEFTDSMKRVGNQVPESLGQVGQTMGEVYQRTRLTGEPLERLTQQVIELGRLGQNVTVEQLTASLSKAGVSAEGMSDALDVMYRVTQTTGTGVDRLSALQEQFGAALSQTGLPLEEQLLLLGQMESQGVNTSAVMGGLTRAYTRLADSTDDPGQALRDLLTSMSEAGSVAEATAMGNDVLGRSAMEVAAAAQSGALDIDALTAAYAQNTDTVHDAGAGMLDLSDKFKMLMNRAAGLIGPVGEIGFMISGIGAAAGPAMTALSKLGGVIARTQTGTFMLTNGVAMLGEQWKSTAMIAGGLATVAIAGFAMKAQMAAQESARLEDAIATLAGQMNDLGEQEGLRDALTAGVESAPEFASLLDDMGVSVEELASALEAGGSEWETFRENAMAAADDTTIMGLALDNLENTYQGAIEHQGTLNEVIEETPAATAAAAGAARDYNTVLDENLGLLQDQMVAYQELNDAIHAVTDPVFGYVDALADQQAAQREANELLATGTATTDQLRDADQRARDAALRLLDASNLLNGELSNNPGIVAEVNSALDGMAAQGLITTEQAARFKDEVILGTLALDTISRRKWQVKLDMDDTTFREKLAQAQQALDTFVINAAGFGSSAPPPPSAPAADPRPPQLRSSRPIELRVDGETLGRVSGEEMRRAGEASYGIPLGVSG